MNNTQNFNSDRESTEDLLSEYNFDYSKARPNRFATSSDRIITVKKGKPQILTKIQIIWLTY